MVEPTQQRRTPGEEASNPDQHTRVGHCKADACDIYVGRDRRDGELRYLNNTPIGERGWLGNPYPLDDGYSREESVALFTNDFLQRVDDDPAFAAALYDLRGSVLGCWCQHPTEDEPLCHGEAIARVIDTLQPVTTDD